MDVGLIWCWYMLVCNSNMCYSRSRVFLGLSYACCNGSTRVWKLEFVEPVGWVNLLPEHWCRPGKCRRASSFCFLVFVCSQAVQKTLHGSCWTSFRSLLVLRRWWHAAGAWPLSKDGRKNHKFPRFHLCRWHGTSCWLPNSYSSRKCHLIKATIWCICIYILINKLHVYICIYTLYYMVVECRHNTNYGVNMC